MNIEFEFEPIDFNVVPQSTNEVSVSEDSFDLYSYLGLEKELSYEIQESEPTKRMKRKESHENSQSETNFDKKASRPCSTHHNFQKHLVTSLKSLININKFKNDYNNFDVVQALWESFTKNKCKKIFTKKFLSVFLDSKNSILELSPYGFEKFGSKYSEAEGVEARETLIQIIIASLSYKTLEQHVEKRKLERKQNFFHYLLNFREELQRGKLKKRMDRNASERIAQTIDLFNCLN